MALFFGAAIFLPLLISIIQSKGQSVSCSVSFIASLLVSALVLSVAGEYIGKAALIFALPLYYFLFYKLDDDFAIFLDKYVIAKLPRDKT